MNKIILTAAYLAPVEYYILMNSFRDVIIEKQDNYMKQTYRNRCIIIGSNGLQTLTVPVEKPKSDKCPTKDIRISEHGNWQHLHWNAIVSAYGSSPFFEYYADEFHPFYEKKPEFLFDFTEELRILLCSLLDISPRISYSEQYKTGLNPEERDLREMIHPKKDFYLNKFRPYRQVFENKYGFLPNPSIIDLLFNMGPESVLYLSFDCDSNCRIL
ncbi:MAG: WbqC family protein [Dysgonamonadaceae bacterium]|jgi:hypothetical protein|nr:WbqC family protein [Dysgonamonadaceae bacterium]